jgi:hypothetical protein
MYRTCHVSSWVESHTAHCQHSSSNKHCSAYLSIEVSQPSAVACCLLQVLDYLQSHPMTVTNLPMQYEAEPTVPLPNCIAGLLPGDILPAGKSSSSSSSSSSSVAREHMARVVAGLLYVACGGLDAAHNLVTPLCWGSWTPYAGKRLMPPEYSFVLQYTSQVARPSILARQAAAAFKRTNPALTDSDCNPLFMSNSD